MVSKIMEKMISYSEGNIQDIDHLIRVWTYAKTIGELEGLNSDTQFILEVAAITHGKRQEEEGIPMVRGFLADTGMKAEQIDRVAFLVGHHHTFVGIDAIDWQIIVEADYIANASENGYSKQNIQNFMDRIVKTESGVKLIRTVFCM